ncbi:MAG: P1 family peptidase, partial [Bacteroidota bacterium]
KGGGGSASVRSASLIVGSLAVVNSVGDVVDENGKVLAGARSANGEFLGEREQFRLLAGGKVLEDTNTTLAVVATNANFTKVELFRIAQRIHDGLARAIVPVHTSYDGDVSFALSCGDVQADLDHVAEIAAQLTAEAIRRAVKAARSVSGIPGLQG